MIPIDPKKKKEKKKKGVLLILFFFFPFPILNVDELILISFLISESASFSFQVLPSLVLKYYISGVKSLGTPK